MSYINHNATFSGGIQELNFDEIDEVGGGPIVVPVIVVKVVKMAGYATAGAALGTALTEGAKAVVDAID